MQNFASVISVGRDWQAFERKLAAGKLIEQAAEEAGIPVDEAVKWLAEHRGKTKDEEALRVLSAEALHHGITTLIELTKIREGRVGTSTETFEMGGTSIKYDHPDGAAARALVQAGLKLRQMIAAPAKKDGEGKDLFDKPAKDSNWTFPPKR